MLCTYILTTDNIHQHWGKILISVFVLITYVVHDNQLYLNSLDACVLCTVYEQDSVVVRHERTNYTSIIAVVLYSM